MAQSNMERIDILPASNYDLDRLDRRNTMLMWLHTGDTEQK
ncbi:hypothetical protein CRENPOLYSF2_2540002 [Crenothrix polyspora]|uniref:Uncharacterized protein n=1 Tax=Crenothrix polyspora TaxID=360316 RepID=A0A1R4H762_9GAMM|nr:hypothetical protein CRENPOLYSF2_2540002 [Crenothrix polyspora]